MQMKKVLQAVEDKTKSFNKFSIRVLNKIMKNRIQMKRLKLLIKINKGYKN